MEIIQMENNPTEMSEYENDKIVTEASNDDVNVVDSNNFYIKKNKILESIKTECILNSGIEISDSILSFGGADKNNEFLMNLIQIEDSSKNREFNITYKVLDPDIERLECLKKESLSYTGKMNFYFENNTIQSYLDQDEKEKVDWIIINDIFNKNLYEENQMKFIDKILSECFDITEKGVIISINDSYLNDESKINIRHIIAYVHEEYNRYRIERLNENIYIITLYTTFLSNKI